MLHITIIASCKISLQQTKAEKEHRVKSSLRQILKLRKEGITINNLLRWIFKAETLLRGTKPSNLELRKTLQLSHEAVI